MIIQRRDMGRALLGARPFHAVLLCGTARDFEQGKSHDEDVEMFLRLAEPPGHDAWDSTAKLKATYKRGYKKAITTFEGRVREALRQLVLPQPSDGRRAPDRLRRRFPLGAPSDVAPSRGASAFQFRDLTGALSNGVRWDFQGIIAPVADAHDGWEATIELLRVSDDGRAQRDEAIEIEDIHVTTEDVVYELEDGRIHLTAAAHIDEVEFIGWTERITEYVDTSYPIAGEIELRVSGSLREIKS